MEIRLAASLFLFGAMGLHAQAVCAGCHPNVARSYSRTGMAQSFYRPTAQNTGETTYYHQPSDTYFAMVSRDGRYFQRQYQIGFDGKQTNVVDKQIDYVLGSGNHVRTFVHRTEQNTLVELPLAWYAEKGGSWAMNPGYDRPDHSGFRRNITYDCMFCHNAYPEIPAKNAMPRSTPVFSKVSEGIDCQRCHGAGERHVSVAQRRGASVEEIRGSIVNPARLAADRQMEVCMQCHLETTSSPLPASMVRYERGPFSYHPGEPLADFMLHFDHAPGRGYDDKFEITGSVYRLRKSQCFAKSGGALKCTTCHNPHNTESSQDYAAVCRQCHGEAFGKLVNAGKHTESADCTGCHMPKRRTDDVVHTVMTDHYIQRRRPSRDLLAEMPERRQTDANAYRGEVVLYYPRTLPKPADELYLAIAQVVQSSNLGGVAGLKAAIEKYRPARAEYYLQLGDALCNSGRCGEALAIYEEGLRREPDSPAALDRLAICLRSLKQYARAEQVSRRALDLAPDAARWIALGFVHLEQSKTPDGLAALETAMQLDPDMPEAYNTAGAIWFENGDARAELALRNAIRIQPNFAPPHNNLGNLLSSTGRFEEARYHFEAAIRLQDDYVGARYNYALALAAVHRLDEAQVQMEAVLRVNPGSAGAHEFLGNLLSAKHERRGAIEQYREAVRIEPEFSRAHLDLAKALMENGEAAAALPHLRKASEGSDTATKAESLKLLEKLAGSR